MMLTQISKHDIILDFGVKLLNVFIAPFALPRFTSAVHQIDEWFNLSPLDG